MVESANEYANRFANRFANGLALGSTQRVARSLAARRRREFASVLATLGHVRLAPRQVTKDVTVWPLVLAGHASAPGAELWPLDEALEDGFVGVRADPDDPAGRLVRIESRASAPVWVPAGEPVGGAGLAAQSRIVPPHGSVMVRTRDDRPPCGRCARALASAFHAAGDPVGFVAAVHDRAVALELVLPVGLLSRRFAKRLEAWAPWLLALQEGGEEVVGLDSPEALIAAVRDGRPLDGRARAEVASADPTMALTM